MSFRRNQRASNILKHFATNNTCFLAQAPDTSGFNFACGSDLFDAQCRTLLIFTITTFIFCFTSLVSGQQFSHVCGIASGDCCSANESPGCQTESCCMTVCECDSYCCEVEWDEHCATTGARNDCGALLLCAFCIDSDGDGVSDVNDICCDTPPNIMVNEIGQPIGDVDNDCDVDLEDFALLQQNLTGFLDSLGSCCVDNPSLCNDNNLCTTDVCDINSGVCTYQIAVICEDNQFCNPMTGKCEPPPCKSDTDCNDDLFCNGVETCDVINGICFAGTAPCIGCQQCDETTDVCLANGEGLTFILTTDDDAITGTACSDTFNAPVGTLQPIDILVGGGGNNDVLNATVAGASSTRATIIDIDVVNLTTLNAVTFDAINSAAIGVWNILSGSTGSLSMTNSEANPVFTLGSGYARILSVTLGNAAGASGKIDVTLNGTATGGGITTPDDAALETLNIDVAADSSITAASALSFFGVLAPLAGANNVVVTGSSMLTFAGGTAAALIADTYNYTGFTGNTGASMINNPGATNVSTLPRFVRYTINDTAGGQAHAVTFASTHNNVTVDVNTIPALAALGTLTLTQGANNDDAVTVNFGGAGTGSGAIAAAATEFLTINSGGTTANAIANVTTNTGTAFVTESVTVIGTQNVTLGTVTTEKLDASALTGTMSATAAGSMQMDGGSGVDTLTGSAAIDLIDGNGGNDVIVAAAGADTVDGGAGNDSIDGGTGIDNVTGGTGADTLRVSAIGAAGVDRALFGDFDDTATTGDVINMNSGVATLTGTDNFATTASIQTHSGAGALVALAASEVLVVTSATVVDLTSANSLNGTNLLTAIGGALTGPLAANNILLFAVADAAGNVGIYQGNSGINNAFINTEITLIAVLSGANVTLANLVFNNFANAL